MSACIELTDLRIEASPRVPDHLRVSVAASYGGLLEPRERPWVEIPERLAGPAVERGDSWLLFFLPLAVTLGRPLRLDIPVDPVLLDNASKLMAVWARWYPELSPIPLEVERGAAADSPADGRTASFFSAGVDSFYTLLHTIDTGSASIDELLLVHGFDIPIANERAFQRVLTRCQGIASELEVGLIPMATNLRETRFHIASWDELSFACLLTGVALQLSERFSRILLPAGLPLDQLRPHASHPETDPLLSNSATAFQQYGQELKRHDKIEYLISRPLALNNLRVCYESDRGENCCQCLKCVLVMTILEIQGALADSQAFTSAPLDLDLLRRTYLSQGFVSFRNTQAFAREHGREDIAAAIDDAFARTARFDRWFGLSLVRWGRGALARQPTVRRLTRGVRPLLWSVGRALNRLLP